MRKIFVSISLVFTLLLPTTSLAKQPKDVLTVKQAFNIYQARLRDMDTFVKKMILLMKDDMLKMEELNEINELLERHQEQAERLMEALHDQQNRLIKGKYYLCPGSE